MAADGAGGACLGAVLAGGASARMGRDKAFLPLEGRPLIAWVIEAVAAVTGEVIICGDAQEALTPLGYPVHPDVDPGKQAMGGVYSALRVGAGRPVLVVSCDLPFVSPAALRFLVHRLGVADVAAPRSDRGVEPLCAVYAPSCEPVLAEMIAANDLALHRAIHRLRHAIVDTRSFPPGSVHAHTFHNVNTPADYREAEAIAARLRPSTAPAPPR